MEESVGTRSRAFAGRDVMDKNVKIGRQLAAAGIIPRECISFTVQVHFDKPVKITTESYINRDDFDLLVGLLVEDPEKARQFALKSYFSSREDSRLLGMEIL